MKKLENLDYFNLVVGKNYEDVFYNGRHHVCLKDDNGAVIDTLVVGTYRECYDALYYAIMGYKLAR